MIREVKLKTNGGFGRDRTSGWIADDPGEVNCSVVVREIYLLDNVWILADHGFHEVVVSRVEGSARIKDESDSRVVLGFVTQSHLKGDMSHSRAMNRDRDWRLGGLRDQYNRILVKDHT